MFPESFAGKFDKQLATEHYDLPIHIIDYKSAYESLKEFIADKLGMEWRSLVEYKEGLSVKENFRRLLKQTLDIIKKKGSFQSKILENELVEYINQGQTLV
jgi:hypothetical protein